MAPLVLLVRKAGEVPMVILEIMATQVHMVPQANQEDVLIDQAGLEHLVKMENLDKR